MANENELLITINAEAKNAKKAFEDIKDKTEDLDQSLSKISKISAIGFAALTAEIGLSVKAFAEAEAASIDLTQALQVQGIAAEKVAIQTGSGEEKIVSITEAYKSYAEQVQELTGIDDDAITKSQAVAQSYLGNTKITKELTQAIADLSTKYGGDLNAAAEAIGRTIGTQTNAFARQGLVLSDTASKAERTAAVLDFVNGRFRGAAEASNQGLGGVKGLATAFGNLQEAIGQRFAPAAEAVITFFTRLFNFISKNQFLTSVTVGFIAAGAAVTGLGVALPILAQAFLTVRAAMLAFGIAANASLAGIPILIGAIAGIIGFVAANWGNNFNLMKAALQGFLTFAKESLAGFAQVLIGAFDLNPKSIEQGLNRIKDAFKNASESAAKELPEQTEKAAVEQDKTLQAAAQKRSQRETEEAKRRSDLRNAENELTKLQLTNASSDAIQLKQQEIEVLKKLETEKNAETIELLNQRREQVIALEDEQRVQDLERRAAFQEEDKAIQDELDQLGIDQKRVLREQDRQELEQGLLTQKEIDRKIAVETAQERIKNRNLELEDRKRYGVAISTINAALRTDEIQAAKVVGGELVALANSKNSTLKAIGKAAAISQIVIGTAESAVTIATQVIRALPFPINVPIAAALSAARVAFGAEQIANVQGAADGALVEGGITGKDSVPFLLEPGELVTPRRNFDEVVGAVQTSRSGVNDEMNSTLKSIDGKLNQPSQTIIQGDVMADSAFVDTLISKINDRLQYGNAKLVGANGVIS